MCLSKKEKEAILKDITASEALEGYEPICDKDGLFYELEQKWLNGESTIKENIETFKKHYKMD